MIRIKDLTLRNFFSTGNQTQAINFNHEDLTLVLGENLDQGGSDAGSRNGVGKSTITHALSFALYGQALSNIKKDNMINRINNKHMLVTVTFEKDGIDYRIERGRKPAILKFYKDNVEQQIANDESDSQGDSRETQKEINELLCMNHLMFRNIVCLNTYSEPFLASKAADQREIIEQLLGISILSEKAEILKKQIKETKDAMTKENATIEATKRANDKIQQSIDSLVTRQKAWVTQYENDCVKLYTEIEQMKLFDIEHELEQHDLLKKYQESTTKRQALNKEKATVESALVQADKSVTRYENELLSLSEVKCPKCSQGLQDHQHQDMVAAAHKSIEETSAYMEELAVGMAAIMEEIEGLTDNIPKPTTHYSSRDAAMKHQSQLAHLEKMLDYKANEQDPYVSQIEDLQQTALQEISWDVINELTRLQDHQNFLLKLLTNKDSFIRKTIIDQNLSYLNTRLSHYLDKMGLPHRVVFQTDLSVEITYMGCDLDFNNLSRGEMTRLSLSLSWAFRDVWENLYQPISLLMIDEQLDNGLDYSGTESAVAVLRSMIYERKKQIFLISHKDELISKVNTVLKVTKSNGFTSYSLE
jgi:DNA repair exonuclease SbcCD ATPase subunit